MPLTRLPIKQSLSLLIFPISQLSRREGTQKDFLSADAVCVIKEISCDIRDMFIHMEKSGNSRARVIGRNGAGKRLLFHRGRKGKHMKRKR